MRRTSTGCERREFLSGITEQMNAGIWRSPALMESRWVIDRLSSCASKVRDNKTRGSPSPHPPPTTFQRNRNDNFETWLSPDIETDIAEIWQRDLKKNDVANTNGVRSGRRVKWQNTSTLWTERVLCLSGGVDPMDNTMPCATLVWPAYQIYLSNVTYMLPIKSFKVMSFCRESVYFNMDFTQHYKISFN